MKTLKRICYVMCFLSFAIGNAQTVDTANTKQVTVRIPSASALTAKQLDSIKIRKANILALTKKEAEKAAKEGNTSSEELSPLELRKANLSAIQKEEALTKTNAIDVKKSTFNQKVAIAKAKTVDSMEYRIDRTTTKEELKALALKINKEHTAVLGYSELKYDSNNEIIAATFNLIDSRLRQSTYRVVPGSLMNPLMVYEYPDGKSGFMPVAKMFTLNTAKEEVKPAPIPQEVLDRIAAQEKASKERMAKRNAPKVSSDKPKIIVRSSTTVPVNALSKEQQELRKKKKINKGN